MQPDHDTLDTLLDRVKRDHRDVKTLSARLQQAKEIEADIMRQLENHMLNEQGGTD